MNSIVILCGGDSSGKTATLKGFFGVNKRNRSPSSFIDRKLDGKRICAVSFDSPQEHEDFCKVNDVQKNINGRIRECNEETKGDPYILIVPFTMSTSEADRKKLNKNCILKPIEELKKSFIVFVIYLKKKNAKLLAEKDALMKGITSVVIETTKDDYDKSTELEKYLKERVIKSM